MKIINKSPVFILIIFSSLIFFNNFSMQDGQQSSSLKTKQTAAIIVTHALVHCQTVEEFEKSIIDNATVNILSELSQEDREKAYKYIYNFAENLLPEIRNYKYLKPKRETLQNQQKNFWDYFNQNNLSFIETLKVIKNLKNENKLTIENLEIKNISLTNLKKIYLKSCMIELLTKNEKKLNTQAGEVVVAFLSLFFAAYAAVLSKIENYEHFCGIFIIATFIFFYWAIKSVENCCKLRSKELNKLESPSWSVHDDIENILLEKYVSLRKRLFNREDALKELVINLSDATIEILADYNK